MTVTHQSDAPASPMDRRIVPVLVTRARLLLIGMLVLSVSGAALLVSRFASGAPSVDVQRLRIAAAHRATFREYIPVSGNVVPARTVYLDAVAGGQVARVFAEEGQVVVAGQPLLELRNADLQLRLVEAEARLTEQVNNVNSRRLQVEQTNLQLQERLFGIAGQIAVLERDLARNERLLQDGTVAVRTVEDMRVSLDALRSVQATVMEARRLNRSMQTAQTAQLQSSVDSMSASLKVARSNLDNLVVRAPISGTLVEFQAATGEAKSAGQRIGQIDDIGVFKVSALVDEFYLGRIAAGQAAVGRAGGSDHGLAVAKIYPNVRQRQFQIDMTFTGDQPSGLRRGQTLQMKLETGAREESLVVANGPWVDETGGAWAYVVSTDGNEALRRAVTIGRRNPEVVEITDGLRADDRLIISSYTGFGKVDRIALKGRRAAGMEGGEP